MSSIVCNTAAYVSKLGFGCWFRITNNAAARVQRGIRALKWLKEICLKAETQRTEKRNKNNWTIPMMIDIAQSNFLKVLVCRRFLLVAENSSFVSVHSANSRENVIMIKMWTWTSPIVFRSLDSNHQRNPLNTAQLARPVQAPSVDIAVCHLIIYGRDDVLMEDSFDRRSEIDIEKSAWLESQPRVNTYSSFLLFHLIISALHLVPEHTKKDFFKPDERSWWSCKHNVLIN